MCVCVCVCVCGRERERDRERKRELIKKLLELKRNVFMLIQVKNNYSIPRGLFSFQWDTPAVSNSADRRQHVVHRLLIYHSHWKHFPKQNFPRNFPEIKFLLFFFIYWTILLVHILAGNYCDMCIHFDKLNLSQGVEVERENLKAFWILFFSNLGSHFFPRTKWTFLLYNHNITVRVHIQIYTYMWKHH